MTREGDLKDIPQSVKTLGRGSILVTFHDGLCLLHSNFYEFATLKQSFLEQMLIFLGRFQISHMFEAR